MCLKKKKNMQWFSAKLIKRRKGNFTHNVNLKTNSNSKDNDEAYISNKSNEQQTCNQCLQEGNICRGIDFICNNTFVLVCKT